MTDRHFEETLAVRVDGPNGEKSIEIIDIEVFVRDKQPVPPGLRYKIRIDKTFYVVDKAELTGEQILALAGKSSQTYLLSEKVGGHMRPVAPTETVDLTTRGVERFATIPKEVREGEGPRRLDFGLLDEDTEFLESTGCTWDAVSQPDGKRIVIRGFQTPEGYSPTTTDLFVILPQGYPDTQIDMVYFHPPLARNDGRPIRALVANEFEGKTWQGWSRHRTENAGWRQGIDNLATHLMLVQDFLKAELAK